MKLYYMMMFLGMGLTLFCGGGCATPAPSVGMITPEKTTPTFLFPIHEVPTLQSYGVQQAFPDSLLYTLQYPENSTSSGVFKAFDNANQCVSELRVPFLYTNLRHKQDGFLLGNSLYYRAWGPETEESLGKFQFWVRKYDFNTQKIETLISDFTDTYQTLAIAPWDAEKMLVLRKNIKPDSLQNCYFLSYCAIQEPYVMTLAWTELLCATYVQLLDVDVEKKYVLLQADSVQKVYQLTDQRVILSFKSTQPAFFANKGLYYTVENTVRYSNFETNTDSVLIEKTTAVPVCATENDLFLLDDSEEIGSDERFTILQFNLQNQKVERTWKIPFCYPSSLFIFQNRVIFTY